MTREIGGLTQPLTARHTETRLRGFSLRVESGPDAGKSVRSTGAELSVGTAPGNDLALTDGTVSRHHCSLTATTDGCLLRDLGSRNSTIVGKHRVQALYLDAACSIVLGNTKLRFDPGGEIREPLSAGDRYGQALGESEAMRRIFALLERVAASDSTILLEGETGTGKGLVARTVHEASGRASGPFIAVDCAAIAPTLIESELFGHAKGSFTGAHVDRAGAFEAAKGGTVFLDEIGELPLDMQPKLLRALEEREIRRVGSVNVVKLDVRIVAATNRDLREEVNRGAFRADLYYRLNTIRVRIPPLRDRREDIELLARHFFRQLQADECDPAVLRQLREQNWLGNVRELRSAVERLVLLGDEAPRLSTLPGEPAGQQRADDLEWAFAPNMAFRTAKDRVVADWERRYLQELMARNGGVLSQAARAAKTDRNYLRELLQRYGIEPKGRDD
jgi:DNA-binding NtrC family response regulator